MSGNGAAHAFRELRPSHPTGATAPIEGAVDLADVIMNELPDFQQRLDVSRIGELSRVLSLPEQ